MYLRLAAALALAIGASAPARAQDQMSPDGYVPPRAGLIVVYATDRTVIDRDGKENATKLETVLTLTAVSGSEIDYTVAVDGVHERKARIYRAILSFEIETNAGRMTTGFDSAALRGLWPLAPGRGATFAGDVHFAGRNRQTGALDPARIVGRTENTWTTERRDTVTVPAGTFDTVVLRRQWKITRPDGQALQSGDYRIWYAPALGYYVRFEGEEIATTRIKVVQNAREIRGR